MPLLPMKSRVPGLRFASCDMDVAAIRDPDASPVAPVLSWRRGCVRLALRSRQGVGRRRAGAAGRPAAAGRARRRHGGTAVPVRIGGPYVDIGGGFARGRGSGAGLFSAQSSAAFVPHRRRRRRFSLTASVCTGRLGCRRVGSGARPSTVPGELLSPELRCHDPAVQGAPAPGQDCDGGTPTPSDRGGSSLRAPVSYPCGIAVAPPARMRFVLPLNRGVGPRRAREPRHECRIAGRPRGLIGG